MIQLRTLGRIEVVGIDPARADALLRAPKRVALLAYLAASRVPGLKRRDALTALLWPDLDHTAARHALRNTLYELRRALGSAVFIARGSAEIGISDHALQCDVWEFEDALELGDLERAAELYAGPFLDGFGLDSAAFDAWLAEFRSGLARAYARALEGLAREATGEGDSSAASDWWRRLLALDRYSGPVVLALMRALQAGGRRDAAIREAEVHAALLRRELGADPDADVEAFAARIRAAPGRAEDGGGGPVAGFGGGSGEAAGHASQKAEAPRASPHQPPAFRLVGRDAEWGRLREAWTASRRGPQFALITGEAGIGKTRLAEELLASAQRRRVASARTRSYAAEGRLAYAPVAEWLRSAALRPALDGLDAAWLGEVGRLLPEILSERPNLAPATSNEGWERQHFFGALARAVLAGHEPRVLLIDDLQWCDHETLEWLHYLLRFDSVVRLFVVGTARSDEIPAEHPLRALLRDLGARDQLTEIALEPLTGEATASLASQVAGRELGAGVAAELHRETEGNPLFVVETIRARLSDGDLVANPPVAVGERPLPPRVHAVIQSRLARLSSPARDLAGVAAIIGREFAFRELARACGMDEQTFATGLDELLGRRIVREQRTEAYDFTHDKLREVAGAEIGPARRRLLHGRVAVALEHVHASDLDTVAGRLAAHYERAGEAARAIPLYQRAGELAQHVYSHEEAILYFVRALGLLNDERAGGGSGAAEHDERELALRIRLGHSLITARGWAAPEVGEAYARARELCERIGETGQLSRVLWGLQGFYMTRADFRTAHALGERLLDLACGEYERALLAPAHFALGLSLFGLGECARAEEHLEAATAGSERAGEVAGGDALLPRTRGFPFSADLGVFALSVASHVSWQLGYPERALARSRKAVSRAERLGHPFSRTVALAYAAILHQLRREPHEAAVRAEAVIELCDEHHFPYYRAWATIMRGWARAGNGERKGGLRDMRAGLDDLVATGAELRRPYYLGLLAETYHGMGQSGEGLTRIEQALTLAERSGERWPESEIYRLRGELLLARDGAAAGGARGGAAADGARAGGAEGHRAGGAEGHRAGGAEGHRAGGAADGVRSADAEAEGAFRRALEIAELQGAKTFGLRAAVSLARLLRRRDRGAEARQTLEGIYGWFTEGHDTADLDEAKALLDELRT